MNHYFIGDASQQIFVSRVPSKKQPSERAAVLFYPFGQEYMRAHKAFRQLATLLARKGIDTYRFDYPCSGDSYGDNEDFDFTACVDAATLLIESLSSQHHYKKIDLIGLRFGAIVASAVSHLPMVANLLLWDPFASGQDFIDDMRLQGKGDRSTDKIWNVNGYDISPAFRTSVGKVDICNALTTARCTTHLLLSVKTKQSKHLLEGIPTRPNQVVTGPENDWNFVDMVGSILMPTELVKSIVKTISEY
jgi:pimeloyl-ACP methyl ester carboxylesterase